MKLRFTQVKPEHFFILTLRHEITSNSKGFTEISFTETNFGENNTGTITFRANEEAEENENITRILKNQTIYGRIKIKDDKDEIPAELVFEEKNHEIIKIHIYVNVYGKTEPAAIPEKNFTSAKTDNEDYIPEVGQDC